MTIHITVTRQDSIIHYEDVVKYKIKDAHYLYLYNSVKTIPEDSLERIINISDVIDVQFDYGD